MTTVQLEKITLDDVPDDKLRDVLTALFDYLNVAIFEESTPDYTVYEIHHLLHNHKSASSPRL